ncbi:Phytanoyl- dioxygenase [Lasiodiplodia theobromae]|uniref:Phytanoyl- dioxygenase n=1 Tax=Lasiodiplodia theobromae TaxID=45133 RepID=UPI0015C2EE14|nr:Phytanoyl- dioxygenase [Lasiodiplodia theobromae]KAF4537672.1 Phytanoyl- dioxygenase [Lasiodiplodia theobromae]
MSSTTTQTTTVDNEAKILRPVTATYNDWRDDLLRDGYAVIKAAIPSSRADAYRARAHAWLTSFGTPLDLADPSTWTAANLPVQSKINTFNAYGVPHEAFMWDVRLEPGVVGAFEKLWGTDELLVSFDALNVTLPPHLRRDEKPAKGAWPHVDQSPFRRGLCCVQGVVNLSPSGPDDGGLVVFPGSHALMEEFFDTQTERGRWEKRDIFMFEESQLEWFKARGIEPKKVEAEPGDLLVWDSRTVHWGAEPNERSERIRTVVYASYAPAAWATEQQLAEKAKIFGKWAGTTHWPHDNIVFREGIARLEDGSEDPRNRSEPREKPVLSDRLLKLAGARRYDGSEVVPAV